MSTNYWNLTEEEKIKRFNEMDMDNALFGGKKTTKRRKTQRKTRKNKAGTTRKSKAGGRVRSFNLSKQEGTLGKTPLQQSITEFGNKRRSFIDSVKAIARTVRRKATTPKNKTIKTELDKKVDLYNKKVKEYNNANVETKIQMQTELQKLYAKIENEINDNNAEDYELQGVFVNDPAEPVSELSPNEEENKVKTSVSSLQSFYTAKQ